MKKTLERVIQQSLDRRLGQWAAEPETFRYMIDKGFPCSTHCQKARQAFASLRYAGPHGSRCFSVITGLTAVLSLRR